MEMKTLLATVLVVVMLPWSVLFLDRGEAAEVCIWFYEIVTHSQAPTANTPFLDIDDSPYREEIEKLYALKITSGTTETTYSPDARLELYQALLFAGKTILRIKEAIDG